MIHITDLYRLKAKIHELKHQLDREPRYWQEKELAHKYLRKVLECVDEISSF